MTKVNKCARRRVIRIGPESVAPVGRIQPAAPPLTSGDAAVVELRAWRGGYIVCATARFRPDAFTQSGVASASGAAGLTGWREFHPALLQLLHIYTFCYTFLFKVP